MSRCVVIDANRIFSEMIAANPQLRRAFTSLPKTRFICPKYVFIEIFMHKERTAVAVASPKQNARHLSIWP